MIACVSGAGTAYRVYHCLHSMKNTLFLKDWKNAFKICFCLAGNGITYLESERQW